jgi:hypothetical protein
MQVRERGPCTWAAAYMLGMRLGRVRRWFELDDKLRRRGHGRRRRLRTRSEGDGSRMPWNERIGGAVLPTQRGGRTASSGSAKDDAAAVRSAAWTAMVARHPLGPLSERHRRASPRGPPLAAASGGPRTLAGDGARSPLNGGALARMLAPCIPAFRPSATECSAQHWVSQGFL